MLSEIGSYGDNVVAWPPHSYFYFRRDQCLPNLRPKTSKRVGRGRWSSTDSWLDPLPSHMVCVFLTVNTLFLLGGQIEQSSGCIRLKGNWANRINFNWREERPMEIIFQLSPTFLTNVRSWLAGLGVKMWNDEGKFQLIACFLLNILCLAIASRVWPLFLSTNRIKAQDLTNYMCLVN